MQSKVLLKRLKQLERKVQGNKKHFVFFGQPSKAELAKVPSGAKVHIFVGENEIKD